MAVHAPKHLSPASKRAWKRICADYELSEPHHLAVLQLGLEAVDRAEGARAALALHGVTFVNAAGEPRVRPEVAVERDSAIRASRMFRELSLDPDYAGDVRVPRPNGARS